MDKNYSVKIGITLDDKSVSNIKKEIENKLSNEKIEIKIDTSNLKDASTQVNNVSKNLDNISKKDSFKNTATSAKKAKQETKQLNTNLEQTEKHIKNATFATSNWSYNWSKAMQSFLTYMSVTQLFNTFMNGIRDMIDQVHELDDSLVELQKVTDLEGTALENFIDKAYEAGEAVAKTGKEMIDAATAFAKSGYDADMSLQLGKVAAMYTNIADEEISTGEAAEFIIAQMKAFGLETSNTTKTLENAYHVIDAVNEVSNNFAVSSADIANNLGKASAVMANAGNSMEQYIGMMTAATEVTRNASKAANGLKTITLRLQGMNDNGEESLELQAQMEGLFNKLNISVYKANGELKNTYEILESLAAVYPKLTNAEKAYVTETIAGKYQAQNAAAILNNWATAVEATETAMNSQGSAAKENEKVLQSITGHLNQLKAAWEELSRSTFSKELITTVIDLGTAILKLANNDFVQLAAKIGIVVGILNILSGSVIVKTIAAFMSLAASEGIAATSTLAFQMIVEALNKTMIGRLIVSMFTYIKTLGTVAATQGVVAASSMALKGAFDLLAAHPIFFALTAFVGTMALLKANTQAVRDEITNLNTELEDLQSIDDRLGEISDKFAEGNLSVSEQKDLFEEIKSLQKKLRDEYNLNTKALNTTNGEIEKQIENMRTLIELEEQKKNKKALEDTEDLGAGMSFGEFILTPSRWFDGFTKEGQKRIDEEVETYKNNIIKYAKGANKDIANAFTDFEEAFSDPEITADKLGEYYTKVFQSIQDSDLSEEAKMYLRGNLIEIYDDYKEALADTFNENKIKNALKGNFSGVIQNLITGGDYDLGNGFRVHITSALEKGLDSDWFREQIHKIADENGFADMDLIKELGLDEALNEEGNWNFLNDIIQMSKSLNVPLETVLDVLVELYPQLASVADATAIARTQFEELGEQLLSLKDAYNDISDAWDEYNEKGYFTVDTLDKLLNDYPQYLDALVDENGLIRDNTDMFQALAEAKINDIQASEDARYYNELLKLAQIDEAGAAQLAAGSINAHDQAMAGQEVNASKLRAQIEANIQAFNAESAAALQAAYDIVEADHIRNNAVIDKTRLGIRQNFSASMGRSSSSSKKSSSKGSSSTKKEKEWWETALSDLKDQFNYNEITVDQYINSLQNLLGKVGQGTEAWRKINKELQKQKLDKVKDDYDAGRISLNQYIISLQNLQKAYAAGTDAWNDLAKAIKKAKLDKLKEQQSDLKSALSAVTDVLDKQIDKYEELKDAADEKYDDEIDKLNEVKDKLDDNVDDYERAQKAVVKFLNEQLDAINNQRDNVENYYTNVIEALEKQNEEQQEAIDLAEAYDALINAMTQRTKKVYREGLGWVFEADQEAIKAAKKNYDDLVKSSSVKEIEKQKDTAVKSLEEQIEELTKYIDSWDKVFDKFDNEKNTNLANLLLGENWTEMVSQLDPQVVDDFSNAYYDLQVNLEETQKQIEELNKKKEEEDEYWDKLIKDLQDYKGEWSDVADMYEEAQDRLKASQIMGANWEKEILDKRIDVLENFKNKYNAILAEIDKVDNMSTNQASNYTPYALPGYADGGEVNYTGLAMLHGTPSKPEYVLNNDQMRNLLSNLVNPRVVSNVTNGGTSIYNYNFDHIELPNVSNANQFLRELKSLVNTTRNQ